MMTPECLPADFPLREEPSRIELKSGEFLALELAATLRRLADELDAEYRLMLARAL